MSVIICNLFLFLILISTHAHSASIEIIQEADLDGLLPSYHLNHIGFELPDDYPLSIKGIDSQWPPLPMFPMFKKHLFSKKFVGIKIPGKYLDTERFCKQHLNPEPGKITIDNRTKKNHWSPLAQDAAHYLNQIKDENGDPFSIYYHNCDLYAVPKNVQLTNVSSFTIGLSIQFTGFSNEETINLGDDFVLGASLNIGSPVTQLHGERGWNFASSFNNIFHGIDMAFNANSTEEIISKTMHFTSLTRYYLEQNATQSSDGHFDSVSSETSKLKRSGSTYNFKLHIPHDQRKPIFKAIPRDRYSSELISARNDLDDFDILRKEIEWKNNLEIPVGNTLVVKDINDNKLIQDICDQLAWAYEAPIDIWPKCRIAATWEPNAYAYPGGNIFITAGLIGILSSVDSVRLVLGHEIGHTIGRHTTQRMPYMNAFMYTANGMGLIANLGASTFALGGGFGYLGPVTWLTWFPQTQVIAMGGGLALGEAMNLLFMGPIAGLMAYTRSNEWQADRFGQQTALATGADQQLMYNGWEEFVAYTKKYFEIPDSFLAQIFADHPNSQARLEKIESRYKDYIKTLAPYHDANTPEASEYEAYQKMHARYFLGSQAFGEYVLKKRESEKRANDYAWQSLFSPAGKCIQYALSGVK